MGNSEVLGRLLLAGHPALTQAWELHCIFFPKSDQEKYTLTVASCRRVASIPIAAISSAWKENNKVIRAGGGSPLHYLSQYLSSTSGAPHTREQDRPTGNRTRFLTSIHVTSMVGTTKSSPSPSTTDVPSSSSPSQVWGRGHFVVHGASHAKARIVRLNRREHTSYIRFMLRSQNSS